MYEKKSASNKIILTGKFYIFGVKSLHLEKNRAYSILCSPWLLQSRIKPVTVNSLLSARHRLSLLLLLSSLRHPPALLAGTAAGSPRSTTPPHIASRPSLLASPDSIFALKNPNPLLQAQQSSSTLSLFLSLVVIHLSLLHIT